MGNNSSDWNVSSKPLRGHNGSVEDIQWSPTEPTVFCSGSVDRSLKIWDTRGDAAQITVNAHADDINVVSWNSSVGYLLASGCDDGCFKVWDLRAVREGQPLANFTHHKKAITSLEWAHHDESVICVSSADNQVTVWDLSVEADDEEVAAAESAGLDFPPQLLFIHQGQNNVKELHFHPQIPGAVVTTAEDGFNIFKPAISVA
jgi:ribosome assembly protein RRB1